mmetsp:Transcript_28002/g.70870  ORF Transcript_28002/g.70870 Transcript_28002/m.70870 type:complete len:258 (-) Transcript_28002:210-983(-)
MGRGVSEGHARQEIFDQHAIAAANLDDVPPAHPRARAQGQLRRRQLPLLRRRRRRAQGFAHRVADGRARGRHLAVVHADEGRFRVVRDSDADRQGGHVTRRAGEGVADSVPLVPAAENAERRRSAKIHRVDQKERRRTLQMGVAWRRADGRGSGPGEVTHDVRTAQNSERRERDSGDIGLSRKGGAGGTQGGKYELRLRHKAVRAPVLGQHYHAVLFGSVYRGQNSVELYQRHGRSPGLAAIRHIFTGRDCRNGLHR